jgi:hypothetical protein
MNAKQLQEREDINNARELFAVNCEVHFRDEALGVVVYSRQSVRSQGGLVLIGFSGKRKKPDFNFVFSNSKRAEEYQAEWYARAQANIERKKAYKAEMAEKLSQGHALAVGDVLESSWGYDQTNYDYYQVTRLLGRRSVEIRELAQSRANTGWLQGDCVPVKNQFIGEPMIKRVNENNKVKVRDWGVYAGKKESIKVGDIELFSPDQYTAYA